MAKMLVISRTYYKPIGAEHIHEDACLLTHRDVLVLLLVACSVSTWICACLIAGRTMQEYISLFLVQYCFSVLVCPAVVVATSVECGVFFSHHDTDKHSRRLVQCIFVTLVLETLFIFYFYV
jgi:hypothetical protein